MILWITSDHIAWLWATGIVIGVGYGDAIQVVTMLVRPHLSDLCSTVLFVLGHLRLPSDWCAAFYLKLDMSIRDRHHALSLSPLYQSLDSAPPEYRFRSNICFRETNFYKSTLLGRGLR